MCFCLNTNANYARLPVASDVSREMYFETPARRAKSACAAIRIRFTHQHTQWYRSQRRFGVGSTKNQHGTELFRDTHLYHAVPPHRAHAPHSKNSAFNGRPILTAPHPKTEKRERKCGSLMRPWSINRCAQNRDAVRTTSGFLVRGVSVNIRFPTPPPSSTAPIRRVEWCAVCVNGRVLRSLRGGARVPVRLEWGSGGIKNIIPKSKIASEFAQIVRGGWSADMDWNYAANILRMLVPHFGIKLQTETKQNVYFV